MHKLIKTSLGLKDHKFLLGALACTLAIALLSLLPGDDLPKIDISFFDKIGHFIAYAALSISWALFFKYEKQIFSLVHPAIVAFVIAMGYGVLMEILQHTFVQSRMFDAFDILANAFGAAIGIALLKVYYSIVKN